MTPTRETKGKGELSEGPDAAARFRAAVAHLASVPPSAAPRPQPHHRAKPRRKR